MLSGNFRPWGHFSWVESKLEEREWCFLGCLSTEDRFIAAVEQAKLRFQLLSSLFIEVKDEESEYTDRVIEKNGNHAFMLQSLLGGTHAVQQLKLLGSPILLKQVITRFIAISNGNIVLDISCFPKRFFFPIIKLLHEADDVQNLLVCYSLPDKYHDGPLSEEPLSWSHIPMFQQSEILTIKVEKAIVGVGFIALGLPGLLKNDYNDAEVTLLFPFPPGPPNYQRTWEFVQEIEKSFPLDDPERIVRVDVKDVSGCYDHILNLTDNGANTSILAPYGPKTQSLAMALFAIKHGCGVFYTQPKYYHPDYSSGVKFLGGIPEIYLYCIKLDGRSLY